MKENLKELLGHKIIKKHVIFYLNRNMCAINFLA